MPPKTRSPRYLSEHERIVIADLLRAGQSARGIARELGRSPSTVSREIERNSDAHGRYRPHHAEQAARLRAQKPRRRRIAGDGVPRDVVARLTAMTMIDQRPIEVEDRVQAGHWEGDLIVGPGNRWAIGTLVERTTRFLVLLHMPEGVPTTATVRQAVSSTFAALPEALARTLTWDQGKELAHHQQITASTATQVFFCEAHSPWQRARNENMNGLLRDYFPKGTDLSVHSAEELTRVLSSSTSDPARHWGGPGPPTCSRPRSPPPERSPPAGASWRSAPSSAPAFRRPSRPSTATTSQEGVEQRPPLPVVARDPQPAAYLRPRRIFSRSGRRPFHRP